MDTALNKICSFLKGNRYVLLILAVGIVLMLLPMEKAQPADTPIAAEPTADLAEELTQILSSVDGIGQVKVLLSVAAGEQVIYQRDEYDTVIITDGDRNEMGLVTQIMPPTYRGAIVVCQGADSQAVCLAVVEAVRRVTGLGAGDISVLKMK